jgi:hypothetical protein
MNNKVINDVLTTLDSVLQYNKQAGMFGIFYKGELIVLSKKRVYMKAGTAKAQLIRYIYRTVNASINSGLNYNDPHYKQHKEVRSLTVEIIDQLIKDGDIEIKQI